VGARECAFVYEREREGLESLLLRIPESCARETWCVCVLERERESVCVKERGALESLALSIRVC